MQLINLLSYFIIYSFLGWILESIYKSIYQKKLVNSGFLRGPFCPIYGIGAILMYLLFYKYKKNIIIVFICSFILFSLLEYFVGWILEVIFKTKYWDYSNRFCNINGRVCLKNSIYWGVLGIIFIEIVHPFIENKIKLLPNNILLSITIITISYLILDTIFSIIGIINIKKYSEKLKEIKTVLNLKKKELKELTNKKNIKVFIDFDKIKYNIINKIPNKMLYLKEIKEKIEELKIKEEKYNLKLSREIERLKSAFPTIKLPKFTDKINTKEKNKK